jgi:hypothetical protein
MTARREAIQQDSADIKGYQIMVCVLSDRLYYEDLLGVAFQKDGDSLEGLNCYNLCRHVYRRPPINIELPPFYSNSVEPGLVHSIIAGNIDRYFMRLTIPVPYCLVTFCVIPPSTHHIGVMLEDCRRFIHVMEGCDVVVERLDSYFWLDKVKGFYRWKKNSS